MRKFLVFAAALLMSTSASATVTYFWETDYVNVTFTVDDFLTGYGNIAQSDIDSCLFGSVTVSCNIVFIAAGPDGTFDEMGGIFDLGPGNPIIPISDIMFPDGSFATPGVYFGLNHTDRLTVTQNSIVPEPATWMTMLAGFAAAGFAFRRRKPAFQSAA